jgi:hypothetical protein
MRVEKEERVRKIKMEGEIGVRKKKMEGEAGAIGFSSFAFNKLPHVRFCEKKRILIFNFDLYISLLHNFNNLSHFYIIPRSS